MNRKTALMSGLAALGVAMGLMGSACAETMPFLAHRAVYELKLVDSKGARGPAGARGLIAYEFGGSSCDGFTTTFRQMMEVAPEEGDAHVTDVRSTTFEDGEFKNFRFHVKTLADGRQADDVDGTAARGADGSLSIRLSRPKLNKLDFSTGILFPTEHIAHIIAAAKAGETTLSRRTYDGTDNGEKLFDTLTVIGKARKDEPNEAAAKDAALAKVPRWPVTISYFEVGKSGDTPSYVLSFDLYENGVSRALTLDYGNFALKGEMTKFETRPVSACKK